jgi:hypothetical protein
MPAEGVYPMQDDDHLLARVDERVKHIEQLIEDFVRRAEFQPVRLLTYGLAGLILSSVVAAIVSQVVMSAAK